MAKKWGKRDKLIDITNPVHYINKALGRDAEFQINTDFEDILNNAHASFAKVMRPTDFLSALLIDKSNDDTKLLCDLVMTRFCDRCSVNHRILVMHLSPYLVRRWPDELLPKTTFYIEDKDIRTVYSHKHDDAKGFQCPAFVEPDELHDQSFDRILYIATAGYRFSVSRCCMDGNSVSLTHLPTKTDTGRCRICILRRPLGVIVFQHPPKSASGCWLGRGRPLPHSTPAYCAYEA